MALWGCVASVQTSRYGALVLCRDMWKPVAKSIDWDAIFHPAPGTDEKDLKVMKAWRNYLKACFIFAMDTAVTKRLPVRSGEKNADFQGAEAYAFNEWKTLHL